jgi:7,8-dihydropterin-6-yl-methyl-4-(beta-D-ribofuranosyl)aminobenzene 5'-phosphate synthase
MFSHATLLIALATSASLLRAPAPAHGSGHRATQVKVTVLSTMLAGDPGRGIGEWGYSALVEVDGRTLLIDTGARPETVLRNATELGIDLSSVTDVVLTHSHDDHTGGLLTLRRELSKKNPRALSRVHVARGFFWPRSPFADVRANADSGLRSAYERTGGQFVEYDKPVELLPGVWFTGPVPRTHPERNWSGSRQVRTPQGDVEDNVPDDASIVIDTPEGLVLVSGCGHAGIVNTIEYARAAIRMAPVVAAIGGFHLFTATDTQLTWTAAKLKEAGLVYLLGGHCTGVEAVYRIRALAGLTRATAVVSAVGSTFTRGSGIRALPLAR